jgi:protocatechuate 3,4-dioxygenase beta subunit
MKRKDFIKRSALAGFSFTILGNSRLPTDSCMPTPVETEGPFPTHHPAALIAQNIVSGRKGTPLHIKIAVYNINDNCAGLKDATVDIWHCDSKGEYSEYGGKDEHGHHGGPGGMNMPAPGGPGGPGRPFPDDSFPGAKGDHRPPPPMGAGSMQAADHRKEHYLRGRQTTNTHGEVYFVSIYPGWYVSRAPHIHLHIYSPSGKSLLVTQVAFPEEISREVYAQGVYAEHGQPETSNATDNVFYDSIANEMANLSGNSKDGFLLTHSLYIKA